MKPESLTDAVSQYLIALEERDSSLAHLRTVRSRLGRMTRGRGDLPLQAARAELARYFAELHDCGLASGTLAGHKTTQLAFWRYCVNQRWIDESDALLIPRAHRYSYRPVHSRAAPADDFIAVLSCLPAYAAHRDDAPRDIRDAALVSLIADSACRRGEAWNLRRASVIATLARPDMTNGRAIYHVSGEGKTGTVDIRFFEETARLLDKWLTCVPLRAGYVFLSLRTGRRIRIDAMQIGLRRICEFAGVRPFGFHAMRKRLVTDAIAASGDPKIGQLLAGHASERTTLAYYNDIAQTRVDTVAAQLADQYRRSEGDDLAQAFFGR